jgi:hypothetical protein
MSRLPQRLPPRFQQHPLAWRHRCYFRRAYSGAPGTGEIKVRVGSTLFKNPLQTSKRVSFSSLQHSRLLNDEEHDAVATALGGWSAIRFVSRLSIQIRLRPPGQPGIRKARSWYSGELYISRVYADVRDGRGAPPSILFTWRATRVRSRVLVHRLVRLLHASFRPRLAATPLRFANPSPSSGWIGDLHPRAVEHARHTKQTPPVAGFVCRSS